MVVPHFSCDNNSKGILWSATSKLKDELFFCTAAPWVETEEVEKKVRCIADQRERNTICDMEARATQDSLRKLQFSGA